MTSAAAATGSSTILPQERIAEIRQAIHRHLKDHDVYSQIREIMSAHAADHVEFNPNSPEDVMKVLRERGVMQDILKSFNPASVGGPGRQVVGGAAATGPCASSGGLAALGATLSSASGRSTASFLTNALRANQKHLLIRLLGGRAFIDALDVSNPATATDTVVVHLQFGEQRFRSSPKPLTCDPGFDDDFLLQFPSTLRDLIELDTPLHLVVTRERGGTAVGSAKVATASNRSNAIAAAGNVACVLGENIMDWRRVLRNGLLNVAVELAGDNPGVPQGIVEMQLELVPFMASNSKSEEDVVFFAERTRNTSIAADREFLIYARRWWTEFHSIRAAHAQRHVKVFAQATSGRMLPVTHFVHPLQPDRVLESPDDAARFVSLINADTPDDAAREVLQGGAKHVASDRWLSPFVFLAQRHGDPVNHATLLCSLLLGFGLDAYCAIGSSALSQASTAAVMVVITRRKVTARVFDATVWNPVTGVKYALGDPAHGLRTIDCLFNDDCVLANVHESSAINFAGASGSTGAASGGVVSEREQGQVFDLCFDDETAWLPMNLLKLRLVPRIPAPPLLYVPLNVRNTEIDVEATLRTVIGNHREELSLVSAFDADLSFVLGQALSKYELARRQPGVSPCTGGGGGPTVDLGWFHQCVKGTIGDGRTFKGFPLNVNHLNERAMLAAILGQSTGRAIIECDAEDAAFAVRCKVFEFAEGVVSVWVMVACRYRSLPSMSSS